MINSHFRDNKITAALIFRVSSRFAFVKPWRYKWNNAPVVRFRSDS